MYRTLGSTFFANPFLFFSPPSPSSYQFLSCPWQSSREGIIAKVFFIGSITQHGWNSGAHSRWPMRIQPTKAPLL